MRNLLVIQQYKVCRIHLPLSSLDLMDSERWVRYTRAVTLLFQALYCARSQVISSIYGTNISLAAKPCTITPRWHALCITIHDSTHYLLMSADRLSLCLGRFATLLENLRYPEHEIFLLRQAPYKPDLLLQRLLLTQEQACHKDEITSPLQVAPLNNRFLMNRCSAQATCCLTTVSIL